MNKIDQRQSFDFPAIHTRVIFGFGVLSQLPLQVKNCGGGKAIIVSDPGLVRARVVESVVKTLDEGGIPSVVFGEVPQDSSTKTIARALDLLNAESCDIVVGVGGGSSIDTAKAVGLAATNSPPLAQYAGLNKIKHKGLPMIAIPTTAGTGSEVSYWSVMTDDESAIKISIGGDLVFPQVALCDPELTVGLPKFITAATGMDALTHAIESFVNKSYQPISEALTLRAMELIGKYLVRAANDGNDREARYGMLLGSTLAGIGMNPTRLGIVHALAMPLGSWDLKIAHGTGNAILLPHVMDFNLSGNPLAYSRVARALGEKVDGLDDLAAGHKAVKRVSEIVSATGLPKGLGELGLTEEWIPKVCAEAMKSGNIAVNPRSCSQADLEAICRSAL